MAYTRLGMPTVPAGACGSIAGVSLAALLGIVWLSVGQAADAGRGRDLYQECVACHSLHDGESADALGPTLVGILNRRAGSRRDFRYSRALAASDIVWSLESIEAFIADPQGLVRGNRMAYAGLPDATDRADLMAYLSEVLSEAP